MIEQMTARSWAELLRAIAEKTMPALETITDPTAYVETFADEFGHRRAVDAPFLAQRLEARIERPPEVNDPAAAFWWATLARERPELPQGAPSLLARPGDAIEIRTEDELAALHALRTIACRDRDASLLARCFDAARWHLDELQPDNATNHPWAIHVFVELSLAEEPIGITSAAALHAQTMLSNCQVRLGKPDLLSAWILIDAAATLSRID